MNWSAEHRLGSLDPATGDPSRCSALQCRFLSPMRIQSCRSPLTMNLAQGARASAPISVPLDGVIATKVDYWRSDHCRFGAGKNGGF